MIKARLIILPVIVFLVGVSSLSYKPSQDSRPARTPSTEEGASAEGPPEFSYVINMRAEQDPLRDVLETVGLVLKRKIEYEQDYKDKMVTFSFRDVSIREFLDAMLPTYGYVWEITPRGTIMVRRETKEEREKEVSQTPTPQESRDSLGSSEESEEKDATASQETGPPTFEALKVRLEFLEVKNKPLTYFLNALADRSGLNYVCNSSIVKEAADIRMSLWYKNMEVGGILDLVLHNYAVGYYVIPEKRMVVIYQPGPCIY